MVSETIVEAVVGTDSVVEIKEAMGKPIVYIDSAVAQKQWWFQRL